MFISCFHWSSRQIALAKTKYTIYMVFVIGRKVLKLFPVLSRNCWYFMNFPFKCVEQEINLCISAQLFVSIAWHTHKPLDLDNQSSLIFSFLSSLGNFLFIDKLNFICKFVFVFVAITIIVWEKSKVWQCPLANFQSTSLQAQGWWQIS